ncbi:hypothetical protein HAX54_022716, partial [Datura stramonium]|nr:hypothetical protein [Datura stramonium]
GRVRCVHATPADLYASIRATLGARHADACATPYSSMPAPHSSSCARLVHVTEEMLRDGQRDTEM